jgi:hypothetical protein
LGGRGLAVERPGHFKKVMVNDVTLPLLLRFISGAERVGILEIQVDFNKTWVELKREIYTSHPLCII